MNLETRVQRFAQQLDAFEELHAGEIKKFEEKLAAFLRLQADEINFLREELAALKQELAELKTDEPVPAAVPARSQTQLASNPTAESMARLTRREFFGGSAGQLQS